MTDNLADGNARKGRLRSRSVVLKLGFLVSLTIMIIAGVLIGMRFVAHERAQNRQIVTMNGDIQLFQEELLSISADIQLLQEKLLIGLNVGAIDYSEGEYNYLAIGNGITKHSLSDFWWNEIGMAATSEEFDYYHIVVDYLKRTHGEVNNHALNFSLWERLSSDRSEALVLIDACLSDELDLVTIQLGENVSDISTFGDDCEELINYIKAKAPAAEIVVVGDFWSNGVRDSYKAMAARNCDVFFASLSKIRDVAQYQCGLGTIVYDNEGQPHTVEHAGAAAHPGNNGMREIADSIIDVLR